MLDETVVPGPLLQYKNISRLARGDDVRGFRALYVRKLHEDAARAQSQAFVVDLARACSSGACLSHVRVFGLRAASGG